MKMDMHTPGPQPANPNRFGTRTHFSILYYTGGPSYSILIYL